MSTLIKRAEDIPPSSNLQNSSLSNRIPLNVEFTAFTAIGKDRPVSRLVSSLQHSPKNISISVSRFCRSSLRDMKNDEG